MFYYWLSEYRQTPCRLLLPRYTVRDWASLQGKEKNREIGFINVLFISNVLTVRLENKRLNDFSSRLYNEFFLNVSVCNSGKSRNYYHQYYY